MYNKYEVDHGIIHQSVNRWVIREEYYKKEFMKNSERELYLGNESVFPER